MPFIGPFFLQSCIFGTFVVDCRNGRENKVRNLPERLFMSHNCGTLFTVLSYRTPGRVYLMEGENSTVLRIQYCTVMFAPCRFTYCRFSREPLSKCTVVKSSISSFYRRCLAWLTVDRWTGKVAAPYQQSGSRLTLDNDRRQSSSW